MKDPQPGVWGPEARAGPAISSHLGRPEQFGRAASRDQASPSATCLPAVPGAREGILLPSLAQEAEWGALPWGCTGSVCSRASQLTSAPTPTGALGLTCAHGFWGKEGPDGACVAHPSCGGRRAYLPLPGPLPSSHKVTPGAQPWNADQLTAASLLFPYIGRLTPSPLSSIWDPFPPGPTRRGLGRGQLAGLGQPPAISQPRALCTDTT